MSVILGAIADDFTGATDLANTLVRQGMRTVQLIDVPPPGTPVPDVDAVVVALKSRTIAADDAVRQSLAALDWLRAAGCRQYFFKYCSTFDSTDDGNIGPVAGALLAALDSDFTIACPVFPETGRTLYRGHLFVGDQLLSDTHMRSHPLTPMTDSNLVQVLQRQTDHRVGLAGHGDVAAGADGLRTRFDTLRAEGVTMAIVDAITDADLMTIGAACRDLPLVTGGSGVAMGLPEVYRAQGWLAPRTAAAATQSVAGQAAVLSGSCSAATLEQVARFAERHPCFRVDPLALAAGADVAGAALAWAAPLLAQGPVLIAASAEPATVKAAQDQIGRARAGDLVEACMARIAEGLVAGEVRRLVVAGGETSGAVVAALGVGGLHIGAQIAAGVPATVSTGDRPLALALKSGNFGGPDFFTEALAAMP